MKVVTGILLSILIVAQAVSAPSLSPRTYNKLTEIQESIDEVNDQEEGAQAELEEIDDELSEMVEDLAGSPLGLALTLQTQAQLKVRMERNLDAIAILKRAVAIKEIEDITRNQLKMFLGQMLFTTEQYRDVITVLLPWLKDRNKEKPAGAYAMLAATYYTLSDLKSGLPFIELAVELSKTPKEPWIQMAFSGNYQLKNYKQSLSYLDQLVFNFPDKKDYWHQKAGVLQMLERYEEAASVKELAYKRGFVKTESEFMNLGQLLASQGAAYKVAEILDNALKQQIVESSEKLLSLNYQAWLQAKEIGRATASLSRLFDFTQKPEDGIRLMQFHVDAEEWQLAIDVAEAVAKLEMPNKEFANLSLYKGIALYRKGDVQKAIDAFKVSMSEKKTAQQAKAWVTYIQTMSQS